MPYREPTVLEGRGYSLRHIGPKTAVWPNPTAAITTYAVLNQSAMIARNLPMTNNPNSPDMVSGSWTGRLFDGGEFLLTFPNKEASDGEPWRYRFNPDKKLQWIEIYNDAYLESVCCIEKVVNQRDSIVISGHDGWFQLKSTFERDWIVVLAPRDVIERATQVFVPILSDDFSYDGSSVPQAWWTNNSSGGGTMILSGAGGLLISAPAGGGAIAELDSTAISTVSTAVWDISIGLTVMDLGTSGMLGGSFLVLIVTESSGDQYTLEVTADIDGDIVATIAGPSSSVQTQISIDTTYNLLIESDGEWITGFVNGQLIGGFRRTTQYTTSLKYTIQGAGNNSDLNATATSFLARAIVPWLMQGSDKGDFALPSADSYAAGEVSTYPWGGLHARYYNNSDLQSDSTALDKIHHHSRSLAYRGSGASEYANQQDDNINGQSNPTPGAANSNWSCIWFGAIYLKLSAGDYQFQISTPSGSSAYRLSIGKLTYGNWIIDNWVFGGATVSFGSVTAASLKGTLSYDSGTIIRDGWYPIKLEYAVGGTVTPAPELYFTPPTTYYDPGGSYLVGGTGYLVPPTSLSPLGCVDQRHQGVSHYDLAQKTAQAFVYQLAMEPKQLESESFPGVMAPRFREGYDTDAVLEPDDTGRTEGLLNYRNTLDSTDTCVSLRGNGAGFQNGNSGQLQAIVFDHTSLSEALFDIQGWQDFSDASFDSLLYALLNSQLGLRLSPWQIVEGDPVGRPRLANMWPLPSSLVQQRWRPGDGIRIRALDINVQDLEPRQILTVTRQIHPNGVTATSVGFAERPRSPAYTLKNMMFQATRWSRNYQKTSSLLMGNYVDNVYVPQTGSPVTTPISIVSMGPGDNLIAAEIRIAYNLGNLPLNILLNGQDVTGAMNGPWTTTPITIPLGIEAKPDQYGRLYAQLQIPAGSSSTTVAFQLVIEVSH